MFVRTLVRVIRALIARWVLPVSGRARLAQATPLVFMWHLTGWFYMLLALRRDSAGRRSGCDLRRAAGIPPAVVRVVAGAATPAGVDAVLAWLSGQLRVLTGACRHPAAVYLLISRRKAYIGRTAQAHARAGGARLGLPDARHWQHLRDVVGAKATGGVHKLRAFADEPIGTIATCVIRTGAELVMEAMEVRLIKMLAPSGNAQDAFSRGWRRTPTTSAFARPRRSRPPPRLRQPSEVSPVDAALQHLVGDLVRLRVRHRARTQAAASAAVSELHFDAACAAYRCTPGGQEVGPLDLCAAPARALRVSALCSRGVAFPWALVRRRLGLEELYGLGHALHEVRRPGRRLLGIRRWSGHMLAEGELGWRLRPLGLPHQTPLQVMRMVRQGLCSHLGRGLEARRLWACRTLRVVREPATTFARQRMNMSSACRHARTDEIRSATTAEVQAALRGEDLRRVKRYWKFPLVCDPVDAWRSVWGSLAAWLREFSRIDPTVKGLRLACA